MEEWHVASWALASVLTMAFSLLVLVAIAWIIVQLVRSPGGPHPRKTPALEVLEERYARGEIGRQEFLDRKEVLSRPGAGT